MRISNLNLSLKVLEIKLVTIEIYSSLTLNRYHAEP